MSAIQAPFARARETTAAVAEMLRASRRIKPTEAAAKFLRNERGAWDAAMAPMMEEPMNLISSRQYTGIVFVGPARSSKTYSLVHGGITYIVTTAPGDTLVVQMSQDAARDFSRTEVDRIIRSSPELAARLSPRAKDDNTYDKYFRSGMALKLGWPAISQLASKTLQYVFLTDYDRPENRDNVDAEGNLWDLASKRIETYMSRGKCIAESSPGEEQVDGSWRAASAHEAPPVGGILSLYNRGTRARWYWRCVHCEERFQAAPGVQAFQLPEFEECEKLVRTQDAVTLAERFSKVACPHCGGLHDMSNRADMNRGALWLHEGERLEGGKVIGERRRSQIASYWLGGVAATYQRWDAMLMKFFQSVYVYVKTADEQPLRACINTDFADAYLPRRQAKRRGVDQLKARVAEFQRGLIPAWARFVTASVDVQSHRFSVEFFAWGVDRESVVIDRFSITSSKRPEGDRTAALDPAAYQEDWMLLIDEVLEKRYEVEGRPGVTLRAQLVVCDSGGREGVTERAYNFQRHVRRISGIAHRFKLIKGDGRLTAPRVAQSFPDSKGRSDRHATARGDVPVWMLNVNQLKDTVAADLGREERGRGFHHLPSWVDDEFFTELVAEIRTEKGWQRKPGSSANEAFDHHVYNHAACIILNADTINWENPPVWATPLSTRAADGSAASGTRDRKSLSELARALNG